MLKYNDFYKKVKEDQVAVIGAFDSEHMMHWVENSRHDQEEAEARRWQSTPKFDSK
jgi:hypothetical protein